MGVFYLVSLWWSRDGPNPVLYRAFICVNRSSALFFLCTLCRQLVGQIILLFLSRFFCLLIKVLLKPNSLHLLNSTATFARPVTLTDRKGSFIFQNKGIAKSWRPTPAKPYGNLCQTCNLN